MARRAIPARVQDEALAAAKGCCGYCGGMLKPGQFEYDHRKPVALGGTNDISNIVVACRACHLDKTMEQDMPPMRKADRKGKATRSLETAAGMPEIFRRMGVKP